MPANIEIKARARDFAGLRRRAEALSDGPVEIIPQVDTFFYTPAGRLKLREFGPARAQLVYYARSDGSGPKRSDYHLFETTDPENLKAVLMPALGVRGIVRKTRYLYMVGQTRVHLDDVDGLGQFVELEVVLSAGQSDLEGQALAEKLMRELGILEEDLLQGAYMDMLDQQG
jgi:adenylate cyclase class IV